MSEDTALLALLDFLDAVEAGIISAKQRIEQAKIPQEDFSVLKWQSQLGSKQPYEQTSKDMNGNNATFQALQQKLSEHGGFWKHADYSYWFHQQDSNVIDRRKTT
jgi:ferritin-like metal-binding protein YciE